MMLVTKKATATIPTTIASVPLIRAGEIEYGDCYRNQNPNHAIRAAHVLRHARPPAGGSSTSQDLRKCSTRSVRPANTAAQRRHAATSLATENRAVVIASAA